MKIHGVGHLQNMVSTQWNRRIPFWPRTSTAQIRKSIDCTNSGPSRHRWKSHRSRGNWLKTESQLCGTFERWMLSIPTSLLHVFFVDPMWKTQNTYFSNVLPLSQFGKRSTHGSVLINWLQVRCSITTPVIVILLIQNGETYGNSFGFARFGIFGCFVTPSHLEVLSWTVKNMF